MDNIDEKSHRIEEKIPNKENTIFKSSILPN